MTLNVRSGSFSTVLVAPWDVDCLQEGAAGPETADVRDHFGYELSDGRPPRHVGHHRDLGMKPKRALRRQWLGPVGVQCGVGQLSGIERGDQILLHHVFAPPDIHQHGSPGHHGERTGAKDALRFRCQRQQADGDIGLVEKRLKLIATVKDRDVRGLPR